MKTDNLIKIDGMKALRDKLGLVDAEKFITLIRREPFDYTEWRRELWKEKTVDELFAMGKTLEETEPTINPPGFTGT